jgi:hypothetical protein
MELKGSSIRRSWFFLMIRRQIGVTISFTRMLVPQAAGRDPSEGQLRRSKKLAYVCFSRAD